MAKGFTLSMCPWVYLAKYSKEDGWREEYQEKSHKSASEEAEMNPVELDQLMTERNSFPELPAVNYTTQYGFGCFEGLKALPQPDGSLLLFRPDENAARFARSMEGLKMPVYPEQWFVRSVSELVSRNMQLGFVPAYRTDWEKDDFAAGHSVYLRPFTYSEPAIGLGLSYEPWVVTIATPVGAYFRPGNATAVTTSRVRAVPGGTGWIKCNSNYVTAILAKKEAEAEGYMEAIFLDAEKHTFIEEGSSCNIFIYLKDGTLVTPELQDTILPGVTRKSVLTLAEDAGVKTEERRISIDEAMSDAKEVFVTGTAAGISYIESITHSGKTAAYCDRKMGDLTQTLLKTLKGIQYGAVEDTHGWMFPVA